MFVPFSASVGKLRIAYLHIDFARFVVTSCSVLLGFFTTVLIARTLGPKAFGIYAFVSWLATVAIPAIGMGMSPVSNRHIAEIQREQSARLAAGVFHFVWRRQYRIILIYCLVYGLLAYPLSIVFGKHPPALFILLAGLSALPLLLSGVASVTLRSLHRFNLLATLHLFGAVATLLLVMLSIQLQGKQVAFFLLAFTLSGLFTLAVALLCILRLLPIGRAFRPGPLLKDRLTRGLSNSLLLFALDAIVWQRGELLLLACWSNSADLGFYVLGSLISIRVMEIAPRLLSTCILPLLLRYAPNQRYSNATDAFLQLSRYVALLAVPLCLTAIVFCPSLISSCLGTAYLPVVPALRLLLISAAFGSVATVSLTHLARGERRRAQVWLGTGVATLNILLAIPCITLWGATGAALASALAQIVSAIGSIVICHKLLVDPSHKREKKVV